MLEAKQNVDALKHLQNPPDRNCSTMISYLVINSQKYSFQMIAFEATSKELCRAEIYLICQQLCCYSENKVSDLSFEKSNQKSSFIPLTAFNVKISLNTTWPDIVANELQCCLK